MAKRSLKIQMGLSRITKPRYASEPDFVANVNAQFKEVEKALIDIFNQITDASEDIMVEALQSNFEQSQFYCPQDTGALKASGYLQKGNFRGKPRVEIGYGRGGNPRYTVLVHERLDFHHEYPTRAKFLERAIMEDLDGIYARLRIGYADFMGQLHE